MASESIPHGAHITVRVPAKVNLFLSVRGIREDGYHELTTVLQTVGVFDELRVSLAGPPGRGQHPAARRHMRLELAHDDIAGLPVASENLAVRAGLALARSAGVIDGAPHEREDGPRTVLELDKAIPVAGGMAGGSADAAAALVALNELWDCALPRERLKELGADLGSDVPFCVVGGTALATGRGTALAQVLCRGEFTWLALLDDEPLSTAAVYREWDDRCAPSEVEPDAVLQALRARDPEALGAALHNDLEAAAFALRPDLAERKRLLLDAGAFGAVLSGSGPTLLGLAADPAHAREIAARLPLGTGRTVIATSPAGGPELRREVGGER